jgi:hypothetical protein
MKLGQVARSIKKHIVMKNYRPYERILRHIRARGDIWMVSQGEYMTWWVRREDATLKITVSDGTCQVYTSLEGAVIEKFRGEFLDSSTLPIAGSAFSGEVWITIDAGLERKELLIELLRREGILNFRVARQGEIFLSQAEMGPILDTAHANLCQRGRSFESDASAVRQIVIDKLAVHGLPLLRIWYHPRVDGVVTKAVFSPRYDVDRAITNLARIRALENRYSVSSTLYIRAFCPFYSDRDTGELPGMPWCSEIGLHGEFVTHARRYGGEFKAAVAEKEHLERVIGRPVLGVCMHGGERSANINDNTPHVVDEADFLYDTTSGMHYYFPFKRAVNARLSQSYCLVHALSDIEVPADRRYSQALYEEAVAKMDEIYQQHGIFVMTLHPVYFGFFAYLLHPRNWTSLVKFSLRRFKQSDGRG